MKLRAYIHKEMGFFHPESESLEDICTFYGILAGYEKKNITFDVSRGTGIEDLNGFEIYEKDKVNFHSLEKNGTFRTETGFVVFEDGCFLVQNDEGLDVELGSCNTLPDIFRVEIVGTYYDRRETTDAA